MSTTQPLTPRKIDRIYQGQKVSDGAGVRLTRIIGRHALPNLDPFLMLDELKYDGHGDIGGFPDHPHRGFQTVTYLLKGQVLHQDSNGNRGVLKAGGVQWMNAGKGVIHSEMLEPSNDNRLHGFQLWVNLPSHLKLSAPSYQEFDPEEIPVATLGNGVSVRVIAGETDDGIMGKVHQIAGQPMFLDVRVEAPGSRFVQALPQGHTAFLYVYQGALTVTGNPVATGELAVLSEGEAMDVLSAQPDTGFLLVAGAPIGEPIEQYGPFVMNTKVEIQQAILDYEAGRLA